jgi:hypothetical protein
MPKHVNKVTAFLGTPREGEIGPLGRSAARQRGWNSISRATSAAFCPVVKACSGFCLQVEASASDDV